MKFIDLSATIAHSPETVPPFLRSNITYNSHADGAKQAQAILKVPGTVFRENGGGGRQKRLLLWALMTAPISMPHGTITA